MDFGLSNAPGQTTVFVTSRLTDREVKPGSLNRFEAIIIPDQSAAALLNGYRSGAMPPEYTGGLGQAGVKALREFVEQGGTLVFLNRASNFAIEQFNLPVRNVVAGVSRKNFLCRDRSYASNLICRIQSPRECRKNQLPGLKIRQCLKF